jgi:hypothetical protein
MGRERENQFLAILAGAMVVLILAAMVALVVTVSDLRDCQIAYSSEFTGGLDR